MSMIELAESVLGFGNFWICEWRVAFVIWFADRDARTWGSRLAFGWPRYFGCYPRHGEILPRMKCYWDGLVTLGCLVRRRKLCWRH